jgi:talin
MISCLQALGMLGSNFTEENHQKCAKAAKPLVQAVEELTTFASSLEFASKQAKISPEVSCYVGEELLNQVSVILYIAKITNLNFCVSVCTIMNITEAKIQKSSSIFHYTCFI